MNDFFEILLRILVLVTLSLMYSILFKRVFPRCILRPHINGRENLGRGIRKIKSESDRAVVYEPHPSVRKYLHQYALFTRKGFKKLVCNLDTAVQRIEYTVQMFDNKGRMIDVLLIDDSPSESGISSEVLLHPDTSYASLIIKTVNGESISSNAFLVYHARELVLYTLWAFVANFFMFLLSSVVLQDMFNEMFSRSIYLTEDPGRFLLPSIVISVACTLLNIWRADKEGIRVVLNDRKHQ